MIQLCPGTSSIANFVIKEECMKPVETKANLNILQRRLVEGLENRITAYLLIVNL